VAGCCDNGNEPFCSLKAGNYLTNSVSISFLKGLCSMEDWVSGTYSTHGEAEKCVQYFGWKTGKEETIRKTWA
jgi:hypothetical protein